MRPLADQLILVKHARPTLQPDRPASEWRLSAPGRASCRALAERLADYDLSSLVSSTEPKAVETATLVAEELGIPTTTAPDLHEHERTTVPLYATPVEFNEQVERFFNDPLRIVFGEESAAGAQRRFEKAVQRVIGSHQGSGPITIVSHGTVISLLVAKWCGRDPYLLWRRLGLPSFVVVSPRDHRVLDLVDLGELGDG